MVEVTQARELATALISVERFDADGNFHPDYLAMLDKYRQAGVQQGLDMAAGVAGCERFPAGHVEAAWTDGDDGPQHYNQACDDIAAAIRKLGGEDA